MRNSAIAAAHGLSFGAGWLFYAFEYQLEAQAPYIFIGLAGMVLLNIKATLLFARQPA